jgi:glutamyl-tRNA synthetase
MTVRVRFAPSPTGVLHVGGARTALYNYLFARRHGGTFVLRIEDTDAARSTDASTAAILDSMRWLGLHWDEGPDVPRGQAVGGPHGPYFQSQRRPGYVLAADALIATGRAYRCYCTPGELEGRREARAARGESPGYDGRCRGLDDVARERLSAEGRGAAIRFASPHEGESRWDDVVRGPVAFQNDLLEDFVLLRSDGLPTYNFACVVDDHAMEISHVIRGDDHISNTPRQIQLYEAFGWPTPRFAHVPMILGADGTRLSKRHGATSVAAYRDLGMLPEGLVNFLVLLGWALDGQRELFTLAELEQVFSLERVGSNPSVFNLEKLEWMNGQHMKRLDPADRVERVRAFLSLRGHDLSTRPPGWVEALVAAIGDRLKTLADAETYGAFALADTVEIEAAAWEKVRDHADAGDLLEALVERLAAVEGFGLEGLEQATRALAMERAVKAGELIGLARVALTGRTVSPGIFEVMALLGKERTLARLREASERWRREAAGAKV